jgi:2-octaprenylphenol hydroxylase
MRPTFEIVIVGAGVAGLAVAAVLARSSQAQSLKISIVDAGNRPDWNAGNDIALRVSALSCGSAELLRGLGAWSMIEQSRLCPYDHMRVWDEADVVDGSATLQFDADEFAIQHLGYIVENDLVQTALLDELASLDVNVAFATPISGAREENSKQIVALESGASLEADLVIAADGAGSRIRESVGIELRGHTYRQTAFVTHLDPEKSHQQTAWQRFLRDGPLGILPLADGRVSVVWSTTPEAAQRAMDCDDRILGEMLTSVSDEVLGRLTVSGPRGSFPLAAQHAQDYVRRGVALVGDAAHTVHPLAGQGANLGLQDAVSLADVIVAALEAGENPADRPVLRRYERARKGANATMMHFMTGLNRLFASDSSVLGELRRAGMQLFNRSGPVRERVVDVALGAGRR